MQAQNKATGGLQSIDCSQLCLVVQNNFKSVSPVFYRVFRYFK
jgi:hypothetical protein